MWACPGTQQEAFSLFSMRLSSLFCGKASFHPALFTFGIVRDILVPHGRQCTGGVFAGVSKRVRAVGDDRGILVGQQLRSEFADPLSGIFRAPGIWPSR